MHDSIVMIDREECDATNIIQNGVRVHSLFKMSHLLVMLEKANQIDAPIIGHLVEDDTVQDEHGNVLSVDLFCNTVDIVSTVEQFEPEISSTDLIYAREMIQRDCSQTESNQSQQPEQLRKLLYAVNEAEPDSTSNDEVLSDEIESPEFEAVQHDSSQTKPNQNQQPEELRNLMYTANDVEPDSTSNDTEQTPEVVLRDVPKLHPKPISCPVLGCSTRFKHKKNINRHITQHHGKWNETLRKRVVSRVLCEICQKRCLNLDNYDDHHQNHHGNKKRKFHELTFSVISINLQPNNNNQNRFVTF